MTDPTTRFPLDVDAITARAQAAPGGNWEAFPDTLRIPWPATDDDTAGQWLAVHEHGWHTGPDGPGPELWTFLAAARDDVLSIAAEVRRLRAERGTETRKENDGSLAGFAATAAGHLRACFDPAALPVQQVLCLAEEAGEFTAAYRRWAGMARRPGTWDDVRDELADVVIAAYVTADVLGIDLDAAWRAKADTVLSRGWREQAPEGAA